MKKILSLLVAALLIVSLAACAMAEGKPFEGQTLTISTFKFNAELLQKNIYDPFMEMTGCTIVADGASVLVFTGCMTAYTTPQLLGGTDTRVLSTMVYQYAMSLRDWTQASVVAVVMIVVTMAMSSAFNALCRKINPMA